MKMPSAQNCSVSGCSGGAWSIGLCAAHYARVKRHGDPQTQIPIKRVRELSVCKIKDCERESYANNLCNAHYQRAKRHGDPLAGKEFRSPKGSGHISKDGYKYLFKPGHPNSNKANGRILEHRFVMAQKLGRDLRPSETVHHKNGNKLDNRPENLELWVKGQPAGQRVEDVVAWAIQIIKDYPKVAKQLGAESCLLPN